MPKESSRKATPELEGTEAAGEARPGGIQGAVWLAITSLSILVLLIFHYVSWRSAVVSLRSPKLCISATSIPLAPLRARWRHHAPLAAHSMIFSATNRVAGSSFQLSPSASQAPSRACDIGFKRLARKKRSDWHRCTPRVVTGGSAIGLSATDA